MGISRYASSAGRMQLEVACGFIGRCWSPYSGGHGITKECQQVDKGLGIHMPSVCFYFQVHQPMRLRHYTVFDEDERYFDESKNAAICRKVANKCYLPANRMLLKLIQQH